jgi:Holliday junction resolvase RusA-like endonuclease
MKRILLSLSIFFLFAKSFAQPITVNTTTYTVPQLVQDVLFGNGTAGSACVGTINNITWSTGSNFGSHNGIGYFTNTNPNFPLTNGVILSTGRIDQIPGPNTQQLGTFTDQIWPGDNQLFNYINGLGIDAGLTDYNDATILEFDFPIPSTNTYYRKMRNMMIISEKGRQFKQDIIYLCKSLKLEKISGKVSIDIELYFKDKRKRDIDNYAGKALFDAIKNPVINPDSAKSTSGWVHGVAIWGAQNTEAIKTDEFPGFGVTQYANSGGIFADFKNYESDKSPARSRLALPTASAFYRGQVLYHEGGTGVADAHRVCRKTSADGYEWLSTI